ncbi:MAG: SIMPL domain-containing protein [Woeseiaceae bacterium]|nr:SIMPL domain-containing protein [Woeseiaceae bacterium]
MRRLALCLLLVATLSCQAADTGEPAPALIVVTGQGSVTATPDMATVTVGVMTQAADAASAVAANNEAMSALHEALDDFGVAESDRRNRGFSVQPTYDHRSSAISPDGMPKIAGYRVSNQVTVSVRNLDRLGDLLGAVIGSGSNTINSLQFGGSDAETLLDEARQLAVKNAIRRATLYAEAAGVEVGRIVSISEGGAAYPRPEMYGRSDANLFSVSSVPISAGENEFTAIVNVVFELE